MIITFHRSPIWQSVAEILVDRRNYLGSCKPNAHLFMSNVNKRIIFLIFACLSYSSRSLIMNFIFSSVTSSFFLKLLYILHFLYILCIPDVAFSNPVNSCLILIITSCIHIFFSSDLCSYLICLLVYLFARALVVF